MNKFIHPEIKENEIFLINLSEKEFENFDKPSFIVSLRQGNVAYVTDGSKVVPDLKPVFGILKPFKLTSKQENIVGLLKLCGLHIDKKNSCFYYYVPTQIRRSGRMNVSYKEIEVLIKFRVINKLEYLNGLVKCLD